MAKLQLRSLWVWHYGSSMTFRIGRSEFKKQQKCKTKQIYLKLFIFQKTQVTTIHTRNATTGIRFNWKPAIVSIRFSICWMLYLLGPEKQWEQLSCFGLRKSRWIPARFVCFGNKKLRAFRYFTRKNDFAVSPNLWKTDANTGKCRQSATLANVTWLRSKSYTTVEV